MAAISEGFDQLRYPGSGKAGGVAGRSSSAGGAAAVTGNVDRTDMAGRLARSELLDRMREAGVIAAGEAEARCRCPYSEYPPCRTYQLAPHLARQPLTATLSRNATANTA
ncbi:MAG: hypothetical protein R3D29_11875 [Nitratireductor sp.]